MSAVNNELDNLGLVPTGLEHVDKKVLEIVGDDQSLMATGLHSKHIFERDIFFGQTTYTKGEMPYMQEVSINPSGLVEKLNLSQVGTPEVPEDYRARAARIEEDHFLRKPSELFPEITGWQLVMTWMHFSMDAYRGQRLVSLYPGLEASRVEASEYLRHDPAIVISPIIKSDYRTDTDPYATEMFGMFGRYNHGDIVPAAVDFEKYPYMKDRSFENEALMRSVVSHILQSAE